jgi:hypothetical protein
MTHDADMNTYQYSAVISQLYIKTVNGADNLYIELKTPMTDDEKIAFMSLAGEGLPGAHTHIIVEWVGNSQIKNILDAIDVNYNSLFATGTFLKDLKEQLEGLEEDLISHDEDDKEPTNEQDHESDVEEDNDHNVEEEQAPVVEEETEVNLESSSSGRVTITNSGDNHNNIMSNFSGSINTNGGDLIVNFNNDNKDTEDN